MITISNTRNRSFLIYKTHLADLGETYTAILKNTISGREINLETVLTTHQNSFQLEIKNEDLSKAIGQGKLLIYNDAEELVYTEDVTITA